MLGFKPLAAGPLASGPIGEFTDETTPVVTPPYEPRPTIEASGAGAPHAPAFGRRKGKKREIYLPHPIEIERPDPTPEPEAVDDKPQLSQTSPLPTLVGFGTAKIGIRLPSMRQTMEQEILADDEEALMAILSALD